MPEEVKFLQLQNQLTILPVLQVEIGEQLILGMEQIIDGQELQPGSPQGMELTGMMPQPNLLPVQLKFI